MIWVIGAIGFVLGVGVGVVLMALTAAKKMIEINSYWYAICLGMTEGEKMPDVIKKEAEDDRN